MALLASCGSHYEMGEVTRTRILIDSRYDSNPDPEATAFMAPYKHVVDSIMGPVVGEVACNMAAKSPESNLSNLLPDIFMWVASRYGEKPDMALYNMGGIRAPLTKGKVTYGDVLAVAPFENKICFFDLSGKDLMLLFKQIAKNRGEGVSHGVELVINQKGELLSARLNGEPIDENRTYRLTTIDYLAEGNDRLTALKNKTNVNNPGTEQDNSRFVIMEYFKEMSRQGKVVDSQVEGRIKIVEQQ